MVIHNTQPLGDIVNRSLLVPYRIVIDNVEFYTRCASLSHALQMASSFNLEGAQIVTVRKEK